MRHNRQFDFAVSVKFYRFFILTFLTAIAIFITSNSTAENINYLQQGRQYYDRGQYPEAVQLWQREIESDRVIENKILGYNYLAIAYQDLGQWKKSAQAIDSAFSLLKTINNSFLSAQVLNTKGSLQLKTGKAENALATWAKAETIYRSLDEAQPLLRSQINQAQALRSLGFYRRAKNTLEQANRELIALPNSLLKVKALQSLGVTLRVMGDLSESETVLNQSLNIARKLNAPVESIQLSLANIAKAKQDYQTAQTIYQQVRVTTADKQTKIEASLNLLDLLIETEQVDLAIDLFPAIASDIDSLSPSLRKIYAQVNLADNMMQVSALHQNGTFEIEETGRQGVIEDSTSHNEENNFCFSNKIKSQLCNTNTSNDLPYSSKIQNILITAREQAEEFNNTKAKSYVLGELGHFYEQQQRLNQASRLTQRAILLAQNSQATDLTADWYWQQGRIFKAQGKTAEAISAYEQAVDTLQSLRQDLVAISPDVRFNYRDRVEPVYRQLVQLLLQDVDSLPQTTKQEHLQRSREAIESLQLAELENYFREACVVYQPRGIEAIDPKAAVIYPILLENRLEVILSVPNQPLQHYGNSLSSTQKEQIFRDINQTLNPVFLPHEVLPSAQQLYDWLIRPGKASLEQQRIETLVFISDDLLRSIPMSVLHDGENYLIEQYDIALTPGLQLLAPLNTSRELNALTGGLTTARQGFPPLPRVEQELEQINNLVASQVLINENFTRTDFQAKIDRESFSTIHLATHGQFSSQAEDTFLLTWADKINVKDLGNVLQQRNSNYPIELLVLSACETAEGDNRAALGMAGVAMRSGARATVATLWAVQDDSTALFMSEFYRGLTQSNITKAEALRQAQLSLLNNPKYHHPYYWSPFVLIGNWQ